MYYIREENKKGALGQLNKSAGRWARRNKQRISRSKQTERGLLLLNGQFENTNSAERNPNGWPGEIAIRGRFPETWPAADGKKAPFNE